MSKPSISLLLILVAASTLFGSASQNSLNQVQYEQYASDVEIQTVEFLDSNENDLLDSVHVMFTTSQNFYGFGQFSLVLREMGGKVIFFDSFEIDLIRNGIFNQNYEEKLPNLTSTAYEGDIEVELHSELFAITGKPVNEGTSFAISNLNYADFELFDDVYYPDQIQITFEDDDDDGIVDVAVANMSILPNISGMFHIQVLVSITDDLSFVSRAGGKVGTTESYLIFTLFSTNHLLIGQSQITISIQGTLLRSAPLEVSYEVELSPVEKHVDISGYSFPPDFNPIHVDGVELSQIDNNNDGFYDALVLEIPIEIFAADIRSFETFVIVSTLVSIYPSQYNPEINPSVNYRTMFDVAEGLNVLTVSISNTYMYNLQFIGEAEVYVTIDYLSGSTQNVGFDTTLQINAFQYAEPDASYVPNSISVDQLVLNEINDNYVTFSVSFDLQHSRDLRVYERISILGPNEGEDLVEFIDLERSDLGETSLNYLVNVSRNDLTYPLVLDIEVIGRPVYDIPVFIDINLLKNYYEIDDPSLETSETKNDQQTTSYSSDELTSFLSLSWVLLSYPVIRKFRKSKTTSIT